MILGLLLKTSWTRFGDKFGKCIVTVRLVYWYDSCFGCRRSRVQTPERTCLVKANSSPIVKWLSLLTLNQPSGVRISVGEWSFYSFYLSDQQLFDLIYWECMTSQSQRGPGTDTVVSRTLDMVMVGQPLCDHGRGTELQEESQLWSKTWSQVRCAPLSSVLDTWLVGTDSNTGILA